MAWTREHGTPTAGCTYTVYIHSVRTPPGTVNGRLAGDLADSQNSLKDQRNLGDAMLTGLTNRDRVRGQSADSPRTVRGQSADI
jgi:hypothetical protein